MGWRPSDPAAVAPGAWLRTMSLDMRSKRAILILCLHALGLILASTDLTVVSWIWGNRSWTFK
jgi:hypothetical protein